MPNPNLDHCDPIVFIYLFFYHLTFSRWTSSLPSCLWSQRIFPSLPGSRLTIFLSRCKFSTLTTRQPMVEFYLLTFPRFPLRKKEHKSYFGKNRTHDFRFETYDFEAMYPNLPDAALQEIMCKLLEYTFEYQSQHGLFSIEIRRGFADDHTNPVVRHTSWSSKHPQHATINSKNRVWLGPAKIFQWLKFVLDEGFVQFGPRMFRQTSGVFTGTSPAPELANNFVFWHEFEFLSHRVNEYRQCCCLLLFLTFSVLVANPKKLLYTVANPARGLLNREKRTKEKVWQHTPPTPYTARSEKINKITRRIYRRYAGGRSRVRTRIPSARRLGLWVWLRNSTLPSAIIRFPVSLLLSSPGNV